MSARNKAVSLALCVLALTPVPAAAHEAESLSLSFAGGMLHPLSGPDHLLAMIAVGLWGAFLGRPLIWLLPVVFPTIMAIGGVMGMAQLPFPPVEVGIACSLIVLGIAIAARWRAPVPVAAVIVGMFGLFHGYAHGLELPSMANPVGFSLGFVVATGLLHIAGIVIGLVRGRPAGEAALRAAGGVIALVGGWYLYAALGALGAGL